MMQRKFFIVIITLIVTSIMTFTTIKHYRFQNIHPIIKKLIYTSLDLQYNSFSSANLKKVFTKEFLEKNNDNFYKHDKWPCFVWEMQERNDDGIKYVTVRIQDRVGEYIQEYSLIKKGGKYLIKSIEYDI